MAHKNQFLKKSYSKNYESGNDKKKRSGAKVVPVRDGGGEFVVVAWNYSSSRGMMSVICGERKTIGGKEVKGVQYCTSESGNEYSKMMAKVSYKNSGVEKLIPCLMNTKTHKITLSEIGMVINPNAPNGGYFGKFSR